MKKKFIFYFLIGIAMGLILLVAFLWSLPDGKLHIVFCDVGQGDGAYLRLPDGRDMLIDAGPPNGMMTTCLGKHMPFWDRSIDVILVTHSEKDHFGGVTDILRRYKVGMVLLNTIGNTIPEYSELTTTIAHQSIPVRYLHAGDHILIGSVRFYWLWPDIDYIERIQSLGESPTTADSVNRNDTAQVVHLRYGMFDVLFTADAGEAVESSYVGDFLSNDGIEILKVPHHGSKTGMSEDFLAWLHPTLAVISVGKKNTYGHPSKEALSELESIHAQVKRTDRDGTIEVISDGKGWKIK